MRKRFTRPPGPPPVRLQLTLVGIAAPVVIELWTEEEPLVVPAIAKRAASGLFVGGKVTTNPGLTQLDVARLADGGPRLECRRVRHSVFNRGGVGLCWSKTPSDGDGSLFICREPHDELRAAYAELGTVVSGLEVLDALPATPSYLLRGQKPPAAVIIESLRPL